MFGSPAKVKDKCSKHSALNSHFLCASILAALVLSASIGAEASELRQAAIKSGRAVEAAETAALPSFEYPLNHNEKI